MAQLIDGAVTIGFWALLIAVVLTAGAGWRLGRALLARSRRLRDAQWVQHQIRVMKLTPLSSLAPGPALVQVRGTVHAPGQLTSPSGKRCVAYEHEGDFGSEPFVLRAEDGAVLVQATRCRLQGQLAAEAVLLRGDDVIVEGLVVPRPADAAFAAVPADIQLLITDRYGEPPRVLFPNTQGETRAALVSLLWRSGASVLFLVLLFAILLAGSCLGIGNLRFPGLRTPG